ncbi:MAG TPA: hypothetical protein PKC24_04465 [Cyclobacteriaceae bacterium]|nr:hypothetical protein [Cyclobacteriaceae bacterium]
MKTKWLFPQSLKLYGWILSILCLALGLAHVFGDYELPIYTPIATEGFLGAKIFKNNMTDEIAGLGLIIGLMLLAFSKSKVEDEYTAQLRLDCLQWSVYAHYLLLALSFIFIYGERFWFVMIFNMFLLLIIFNVRFHILLHRHIRSTQSEVS